MWLESIHVCTFYEYTAGRDHRCACSQHHIQQALSSKCKQHCDPAVCSACALLQPRLGRYTSMHVSQLCQQQLLSDGGNPVLSSSCSRSSSSSVLCRRGLSSSNRDPMQLTGCLQHYHTCCRCSMHCRMVSTPSRTPSPLIPHHHHSTSVTSFAAPRTFKTFHVHQSGMLNFMLKCVCMHAWMQAGTSSLTTRLWPEPWPP